MSRPGQIIRRFLKGEEIPRWFGFSLVLIYLVGLGTVAQMGIVLARRDATAYFQQSSRYAVEQLARQLDDMAAEAAPKQAAGSRELALAEARLMLREFARVIPARAVRVVADGQILASSQPSEAGIPIELPAAADLAHGRLYASTVASPDGSQSDHLLRVRLDSEGVFGAGESGAQAPTGQRGPGTYLEAVLPAEIPPQTSLADHAATLTVVLIVFGALFLVYRCLREQLRGVQRIADRLETHRDRMSDELSSLHIADALDTVTQSWNGLVDLTQQLLESVHRAEANEELSRALQKQSGGAVAEALHVVPDGIIFVTDEVRFEYVNAAALRLLGWSAENAKQWTLRDAGSSGVGEKVIQLLRDALRTEGSFEARTEVIEWEQDQSSYRVLIIPLQRSKQSGRCVVVIRDVSQQLRAERAREEFVAQVTHELRTPLTNIRAYTETLSSGMFEDPKVITECYNVITKETRRLSRLIEDILSVSQLEVGSIELLLDQVDVRALLNDSLRDVRGLADEKNIDVQLVFPSKLEPVRADRDKLAVVVNNLLGNAIKYTPADGNVIIGCQVSAEEVVLTFKDNGIGIDPADHARVFEKFQRGAEAEVQQETGTGIGLYTAREIVRRHGGELELISEKGKGSTFLVRLPRSESRMVSKTTRTEAKTDLPSRAGATTALVEPSDKADAAGHAPVNPGATGEGATHG